MFSTSLSIIIPSVLTVPDDELEIGHQREGGSCTPVWDGVVIFLLNWCRRCGKGCHVRYAFLQSHHYLVKLCRVLVVDALKNLNGDAKCCRGSPFIGFLAGA